MGCRKVNLALDVLVPGEPKRTIWFDVYANVPANGFTVGPEEKSWRFTPARPWRAGTHRVDVSPDLEDVAGNTPSRPFDLHLLTPRWPAQKLHVEFEPR